MNKQGYRWEVQYKGKAKDILNILLKVRAVKGIKEKKEFISPRDPSKLSLKELGLTASEIKKTIQRIKKAIRNNEEALVYGDYDADGICGTAILWESLYTTGLKVLPYIPERFSEGYGLNIESLKKLARENPDLKLIFTVDHGIVANSKVDVASSLGIDIVITDHHEPHFAKASRGKERFNYPKAYSIIHTTKISGSAVAWILAREVRGAFKIDREKMKFGDGLDLVAIGMIADQMPLLGANRSFAKYGLESLNKTIRPGLNALFTEATLKKGGIGTYAVGFMIAPRINATGRLTNAIDSLRLLCTKDRKRAGELALSIGKINSERQKIVDSVVAHALRQAQGARMEGVIVMASKSYHEGVIGLAAARIVDEFYRPAIVMAKKGEISKASARSISGFNIIEAIRKLEGFYLEGGGHPMAAGFSIETLKIAEFTKKINEVARPLLTDEILSKRLRIDMELNFNQINYELFNKLKVLEPTGLGNPTPTFVSRDIEIIDARTVGSERKHLKLKLKQDLVVFDAIAFGFGELFSKIAPGSKIDIVYSIEDNFWNNHKNLQLKIKDLRN